VSFVLYIFFFDPRVFCTSDSSTNSLEGVQKFYYGPLEIIFYITGWSELSCAHSCVKGKESKLSNFVVKRRRLELGHDSFDCFHPTLFHLHLLTERESIRD
jgi:hypothetical protein